MGIKPVFDRLKGAIGYLEIVVYICVLILIIRSILKSIYDFVVDKDMNSWYEDTKLSFSYTISISLTSILFLEILKLFYIKTAHQILIISGITALKLVINHFVENELKELQELKKIH